MTRTAPLVMFGYAPRMSVTPATSVWSTLLGAHTMAMPVARMAWRWASVFNL